ncbi:hypothetical protein SLA2020_093420 [Shorea laevis]
MASKLSFTCIPELPLPIDKFPKSHQRIHLFPLPPPNFSPLCSSLKNNNNSSCRGLSVHALKQEVIQSPNSDSTLDSKAAFPASSKLVLVVGASGGVAGLIGSPRGTNQDKLRNKNSAREADTSVIRLLEEETVAICLCSIFLEASVVAFILLAAILYPEKATTLFGNQDEKTLQVYKGDTRNLEDLDPSIFERWDGDNTPERVDWEFNELPWSIMNLFGILKYKKKGGDFLRDSGLSFTIIRLTDGPYTSYDLNTLIKATAGQRQAVLIGLGDKLVREVSKLVVAEACIQALDIDFTEGKVYEINSVKGDGPGSDPQKWQELFKAAESK